MSETHAFPRTHGGPGVTERTRANRGPCDDTPLRPPDSEGKSLPKKGKKGRRQRRSRDQNLLGALPSCLHGASSRPFSCAVTNYHQAEPEHERADATAPLVAKLHPPNFLSCLSITLTSPRGMTPKPVNHQVRKPQHPSSHRLAPLQAENAGRGLPRRGDLL